MRRDGPNVVFITAAPPVSPVSGVRAWTSTTRRVSPPPWRRRGSSRTSRSRTPSGHSMWAVTRACRLWAGAWSVAADARVMLRRAARHVGQGGDVGPGARSRSSPACCGTGGGSTRPVRAPRASDAQASRAAGPGHARHRVRRDHHVRRGRACAQRESRRRRRCSARGIRDGAGPRSASCWGATECGPRQPRCRRPGRTCGPRPSARTRESVSGRILDRSGRQGDRELLYTAIVRDIRDRMDSE